MAEGLAVFAASAQLLELAVGSIVKAKRLWDEIDQAPSEIQDLMLEIQAVERYYKAVYALDDLVQSLSKEVNAARGPLSRKAVAAKIVLQKRSMRRLEAKLRSARDVLQLSLSLSSL
ncbi:uncharacterized protein DNG_10294 [Cephalotrichum gorgonifer]|uniref:Uncharacterized protein n=1 Tax=Cephalotrichum gorgonifer TaxID=2041049 RepID=A0AAE8N864_9PEZI|nr:uncharacterized protein DNG_10294 [Cephalotrichum gorgonifer]